MPTKEGDATLSLRISEAVKLTAGLGADHESLYSLSLSEVQFARDHVSMALADLRVLDEILRRAPQSVLDIVSAIQRCQIRAALALAREIGLEEAAFAHRRGGLWGL